MSTNFLTSHNVSSLHTPAHQQQQKKHIWILIFMFIVLLNFPHILSSKLTKSGRFLIRKNIQILNTLHGNIKSKLDFNGNVLIPKNWL